MNDNKINIAQIGVGYWGPNLLRNLMSNKESAVSNNIEDVFNGHSLCSSLDIVAKCNYSM